MGVRNLSTWQGYGRKFSVTCDHHPLKSRFGILGWEVSILIQLLGSTSDQSLVCFTSLFVINHRDVQLKDFLSVFLSR